MGIFDRFKGGDSKGGNPLSMVMDFLGNPQKLKDMIMTQLYPSAEKSLIKYIDGVETEEGEAQTAIVIYKKEDKLRYCLTTFDKDTKAVRMMDDEDLKEKLETLAANHKVF